MTCFLSCFQVVIGTVLNNPILPFFFFVVKSVGKVYGGHTSQGSNSDRDEEEVGSLGEVQGHAGQQKHPKQVSMLTMKKCAGASCNKI